MQIRELVGGEVVTIAPDEALIDGARRMDTTGVGSLAVVVDGALEGILTERDILRAAADNADFARDSVSAWMTEYPDSFTPEMSVSEAANWMLATGYRHLPVIDGGTLIGVISIKDVLWAMTEPTAV
jgi:CBS domain-containing protein